MSNENVTPNFDKSIETHIYNSKTIKHTSRFECKKSVFPNASYRVYRECEYDEPGAR